MKKVIMNFNELSDSKEMLEGKEPNFIIFFIYFVLIIFVITFIWMWIGEIDIVVKANGMVRPASNISIIRNATGGNIQTINYVNTKGVKKGDILYTLDINSLDLKYNSLLEEKRRLEKELELLKKFELSIKNDKNIFKEEKIKYYNRFLVYKTNHEQLIIDFTQHFIQDGHFSIGGRDYIKYYYYFTNKDYVFYKDDKGYYIFLDDKKAYLSNINSEEPDKYMKLSLDNDGNIIYRLGLLLKEANEHKIKMNLNLSSVDKEKELTVKLQKVDFSEIYSDTSYNSYKKDDISVLEIRTFGYETENISSLKKFVNEAKKFSSSRYTILDLRSNPGGDCSYPRNWIKNFTGEHVEYMCSNYQLLTGTAGKMLLNSIIFHEKDPEKISTFKQNLNELKKVHTNGWYLDYPASKKLNIDNLLIVLTDPYISSAGEYFIILLKQIDNVIFMGTNTSGMYITGNNGSCKLPYSKLEISFGTALSLYPDHKFREGMGFSPDFWVDSDNLQEVAIRFIENYWK